MSDRKQVVVVPPYELHHAAREVLTPEFAIVEPSADPDQLAKALAGAHALVGLVSADVLAASPVLEVIGIPGSGWDQIDVAGATARGIPVVNAAGAQHAAVAEHAVGLMLSLVKRIAVSDRLFHAEKRFVGRDHFTGDAWPGWPEELGGKTIGIIGFGFIGRDLARKCRLGFDMTVLAYDPYVDPDEVARQGVAPVADLDRLLGTSDFVSLHLPLTQATRHIIGERELRLMQPHSYLINLSRAGTVAEEALVRQAGSTSCRSSRKAARASSSKPQAEQPASAVRTDGRYPAASSHTSSRCPRRACPLTCASFMTGTIHVASPSRRNTRASSRLNA